MSPLAVVPQPNEACNTAITPRKRIELGIGDSPSKASAQLRMSSMGRVPKRITRRTRFFGRRLGAVGRHGICFEVRSQQLEPPTSYAASVDNHQSAPTHQAVRSGVVRLRKDFTSLMSRSRKASASAIDAPVSRAPMQG